MHDRVADVRAARPVVFAGPSATVAEIRAELPDAVVLPPVARDQLYEARERGARFLLIIDGLFSHRLALSPREVVDVLRDGAVVMGAASMGAVRAAECWPAGMKGVGPIFRMFRAGILRSDDEVAVSVLPDRDYSAGSIPLVHVRYAMAQARRAGLVTPAYAVAVVERCRATYFAERSWEDLVDREDLLTLCRRIDVKRHDALRAAVRLRRLVEKHPASPVGVRLPAVPLRPPPRYPGHDPLLGGSRSELGGELLAWLFGSGRYREHAQLRTLRPLSSLNPDVVWDLLDDAGELETELMRRYAVTTLASVAESHGWSATDELATYVRGWIAAAHGAADWDALTERARAGRLDAAIEPEWIERASDLLGLALTAAQRGHDRAQQTDSARG
jgi:hypothetical protein